MFCSRCRRSFAKIMLVTIKMQINNISFSIFEIQKLFNSETNHECNCPFCNNTALTILKTNLLLGSAFEISYSELCIDSKLNSNGFLPGPTRNYSTCQSTGALHMQI